MEPGVIGRYEGVLHFFVKGDLVRVCSGWGPETDGIIVQAGYSDPNIFVEFPDHSVGEVDYRRLRHKGD